MHVWYIWFILCLQVYALVETIRYHLLHVLPVISNSQIFQDFMECEVAKHVMVMVEFELCFLKLRLKVVTNKVDDLVFHDISIPFLLRGM